MKTGCYTALITPFQGDAVDFDNLARLADFQVQNGITGIVAVGTTGESPALDWQEHNRVIETLRQCTKGRCLCIAGTGSNNTKEALSATGHAFHSGADAALLVDPYYNGPSSLEIRKEYIEPIAKAFPGMDIIPYVVPGRTGTQLLPEDLAQLYDTCKNVNTVKEATGNLENMKKTRRFCGNNYRILSGDDALTHTMMTDPDIRAAGAISVMSNIAPKALTDMIRYAAAGDLGNASRLNTALSPLFDLVMVKTTEMTPYGEYICKARNPLPVKTLMALLGMPTGPCRQPLGKMTRNGLAVMVEAAKSVWKNNPEILEPIAGFFKVDIEERLNHPAFREPLCY
jgi:4-hydroxy-tetrahydrodipicolinate synthase